MLGKKRSRPKSRRSLLDFTVLEPRNMLSVSLPSGANLVNNGSFAPVVEGDTQFYRNSEVAGWSALNSESGQRLNLLKLANEHEFVLDLDSTGTHFDQVFQDIGTRADVGYVLAFDLRERPVNALAESTTNDVEVFWNNESMGVFQGTQQWQSIVLNVTGAYGMTRLEFREVGSDLNESGDGRGPFVDNVSLVHSVDGGLQNGSFEQVGNTSQEYHHQRTVTGWQAMGTLEDRIMQIVNDADASDGARRLDLDSAMKRLDRVYQDVATEAGRTYFVSFDIKASDQPQANNDLRVRWNDGWAGSFEGTDEWQTYGILVEADSDLTRLIFRETAEGEFGAGDSNGPLVDNVYLHTVSTAGELIIVDANGVADGNDSNALFSIGDGPTLIATTDLTVENKAQETLSSAEIQLSSRLDVNSEFLSVDVGDSALSSSYDTATGVLTVSGLETVAIYQQVLQSLRYDNTAEAASLGERTVSVLVNKGQAQSTASVITVNVQNDNQAPILSPIGDPLITLGEGFQLTVNATDPDNDPLTYQISSTGEPITGGSDQPSISPTGQISWSPEREGLLTVTVTVTDDAGASDVQDFTITVARNAEVPGDFDPFSGNRQLSNVTPSLRNQVYDSAPEMSIDTSKEYEAIFRTADGDIRVLLNDNLAPVTVNNFVNLAEDGFYDGVTFHRVISLGTGFIAQGGDPTGSGSGGPGYRFDDEAAAMTDFDTRDLLAMANAGTDTNGSQFFFTMAPQTHLNGRHAIFGQVIEGSDVVDAINKRDVNSATPAEVIYSVDIVTR